MTARTWSRIAGVASWALAVWVVLVVGSYVWFAVTHSLDATGGIGAVSSGVLVEIILTVIVLVPVAGLLFVRRVARHKARASAR